jgi:hypothetical protein
LRGKLKSVPSQGSNVLTPGARRCQFGCKANPQSGYPLRIIRWPGPLSLRKGVEPSRRFLALLHGGVESFDVRSELLPQPILPFCGLHSLRFDERLEPPAESTLDLGLYRGPHSAQKPDKLPDVDVTLHRSFV